MRQCPDRYTIRAGRNLPDKEFRYLRTVIVTAAVYWGFNSMLAHLLLTFQHRAGVSPYTSSFDLAETCVFAKQSPGPIHCGHVSVASLFPKLRDQFAEFLNYPSPVGLRILFPSTCVGLRYGRLRYTLSFSRPRPTCFPTLISVPYARGNHRPGHAFPGVPYLKSFGGYGISTVCASTTPFGLALAPGLLGADEPSSKNLRLSANMILTHFALLIPAFSLE